MGFFSQADIPLFFVTLVLAWATIKLSFHTKTLANLTQELVKIEKERATREQREKRRKDLTVALEATKTVQAIDPQRFAAQFAIPVDGFPMMEVKALETLHAMKRYLDEDDTECHRYLEDLRRTFDTVRREKSGYCPDTTKIERDLKTLQGRLQWFVDKKSEELSISA